MNHLYESVAYLKGLAEGLNIKESSKEGKLLLGILDTLEEVVSAMEEMQEEQDDLADYVEALDDDLADVEEEFMGEEEGLDEDDDIDFMEVDCPKCGETIYLDEDILYDDDAEVLCPQCHELIEFDEADFCVESCCCGGDHHLIEEEEEKTSEVDE